jgi:hypothetical protein
VSDIEGRDGELIDRFLLAANHSPAGSPSMWVDLGWVITFCLGGPFELVPDTGREPEPGTVGAMERKGKAVVGRQEYFDAIGARLRHLVRMGMNESFLVRALSNELSRWREHFASKTGEGDRNREALRKRILSTADDPERVAEYRREQVEMGDRKAAQMSDEEFAEEMRRSANDEMLQPTTAEQAVRHWAEKGEWEARRSEFVSENLIEQWGLRRALRKD